MNIKLTNPDVSIWKSNSPKSDGVLWILVCSAVNTSLSSLNNTISDNCIFLLLGFLSWIKYLAKLVLIGKSKNLEREVEVLENNELISSISKTLFVLHSMYGDNFVFCNFINLDLLLTTSTSIAKSKLLIVSTRFWSIISSATVSRNVVVVTPALVADTMPTSAKFFNPLVCKRRFTGFTKSSYVIELLTV